MRLHKASHRRARYQDAISWIAGNDDTEWLCNADEEAIPSVTASLVADLFFRDIETVIQDLRRALKRRQGSS